MKIRIILLSVLLLFGKIGISQTILSEKAKIYIIVCSPGKELYQAFGHNAVWVIDSAKNVNCFFHFGTFNYNTPNFYLKFIRGKLDYMLAFESYRGFVSEYTQDKRDVWQMELNLNKGQKQRLYEYLIWNGKEENKYYKYDFFMDNCATRVRDLLTVILADSVNFPSKDVNLTYRQAIKPYLKDKPWTRFGINLLLGMPADKKLDLYSAMFLPYFIDSAFMSTTYKIADGSTKNLISENKQMIVSNFEVGKMPLLNPDFIFWAIAVVLFLMMILEKKISGLNKGVNFTFYLITGIAGLLMVFMWFFTDHTPTKWNLNIIWAFPLNLIFAFYYLKGKKIKLIKYYSLIFSLIYLGLCVLYPVFPQQFDTAIIPFLLIFSLRQFYIFKKLK